MAERLQDQESQPTVAITSAQAAAPILLPNDHQEIDIDQYDDSDSTFGSESSSQRSATIASSVYNYKYENGRRYHGYRSGKYLLPNDEEEQDRLDLIHHSFRLILGGALYRAPIDSNPQRILDLGTGTGIWAIDVADELPSAKVIGVDLSPIQPNLVPPNCFFYVDDIESDWIYTEHEAFDLIHGRALGGSIADFDLLYRQSYTHLKPGGWIEIQEYESTFFSDDDPELKNAPTCLQWANLCNEASERVGRKLTHVHEQKQKLIDAGFIDVQEDIYKIPIGTWAKDKKLKQTGAFVLENTVQAFESFTPGLVGRVFGWSDQECQILVAKATAEVRNPKLHMYVRFRYIYGRKPPS